LDDVYSQYTTGGGDIAFDTKVMHGYRRFCNKIYQATKYFIGTLEKFDKGFLPQATAGRTGKEALAERWILSRFNTAAKEIHHALSTREFSRSTHVVYTYFYDELCDVYIENSKAMVQNGTVVERTSALNTLYTALEGALRMIHPFMPFLSEELWQRLPRRRNDTTPSITIASYPSYEESLYDPESEATYELILGCSKGVRSLLSEYNIERANVFVQTTDAKTYEIAKSQVQAIKSLAGKSWSEIAVLPPTEATPTGCAVFAVSTSAAIFLEVVGHVNIDKEITKSQVKIKKAADSINNQLQRIEGEDFKNKVSDAVQAEERKRLEEMMSMQANYEKTLKQFQSLKLETH